MLLQSLTAVPCCLLLVARCSCRQSTVFITILAATSQDCGQSNDFWPVEADTSSSHIHDGDQVSERAQQTVLRVTLGAAACSQPGRSAKCKRSLLQFKLVLF